MPTSRSCSLSADGPYTTNRYFFMRFLLLVRAIGRQHISAAWPSTSRRARDWRPVRSHRLVDPLLADQDLGCLDDHCDLVTSLQLQTLDRTIGNRRHHLAGLDFDLDLGHHS